MSPPDLLPTNSPSLSQQLRSRTDQILARLIRTNYNTQFAQIASELTGFRDATACGADGMDDASLSETFRNTAQLTTYDAYAPFLARFHEKPCRESAVLNLLAPGLPDYLCFSSSTSGGVSKIIPKYDRLSRLSPPRVPVPKRTTASLFSLRYNPLDIKSEDDRLVKKVHFSSVSSAMLRWLTGLDPSKDEERMATFLLDHAAPFAAGFITKWRSLLLIQGLFALSSRSLETMCMVFVCTFVEMMRHLDAEFDMLVDCIANGTIPDLEGIAEVRHYLESNILPDPERAAELRKLGRPCSRPGWCSHAWPNLRSITGTASGFFASSIPLAQWFLGPNATIRPRGYATAEGWIGSPYNPLELNQFKLNSEHVTEFLDVSKTESINAITQPWEVELGRRYEIVITTPDGLWRYRIGDVVEMAGFDPRDGTPVIRFVERRNALIRTPQIMLSEKELRSAMSFTAADALGNVVDWTATLDERRLPATIGFFVELADDEIANSALATQCMLAVLSRLQGNVSSVVERGLLGKPTIRIVEPGTFSDFRQLKIEECVLALGQVKVPVVLPKAAYVDWFSKRVVKEL